MAGIREFAGREAGREKKTRVTQAAVGGAVGKLWAKCRLDYVS